MAGVRIEGDIGALKQMISHLSNLDKKGINAALSEALLTSIVERFDNQRDPEDKKWAPSIRVKENDGKTLSDSTDLRTSIHSEYSEKGVAIGTNKLYAATHQFGDEGRTIRAKTKSGLRFQVGGNWRRAKVVTVNIPKRAFLGISNEDMEEIKGTLEDAISMK